MTRYRLLTLFTCITLSVVSSVSKTIYDTKGGSVGGLFRHGKAKYVLKHRHQFVDTLFVPNGSELKFEGGALSGPIVFANTLLSGTVNLKGSSVFGNVRNSRFDASWLCVMDGVTDDAPRINEMVEVCGHVFFPKGYYRLVSAFNPEGMLPKAFHPSVKGHIAICKSNVTLEGESGATFVTDKPLITLSVFSQPNDIEHSISGIKIENLIFEVHNDGKNFHEFMHTVKTMGVNDITIKNCTFKDFWGDGICMSHYGDTPKTGERTRNQNVRILNNTIIGGDHHSNRNGISVINGKNVLIKGNIIKNTSRKDMPGGIDVEPNNSAYTIENIRIEDNILEGIEGSNGAIGVIVFKDAPAHKISIIGNRILNCKLGLFICVMSENTSDHFTIQGNYTDERTMPYHYQGNGHSMDWNISDNTFEKPCVENAPGDIKVDNLVMKKSKKKEE